jgi:hypothetical protein
MDFLICQTSAASPAEPGELLFWFRVLCFRLMVKRGTHLRPQASEGEAQHGLFCWTRCVGQGNERLSRHSKSPNFQIQIKPSPISIPC